MAKPSYYKTQIRPARAELAKRFPNTFMAKGAAAKLPLKIGIDRDVIAVVKDIPRAIIKRAIADYCEGPKYASAMTEGATRIDLDGQPAGVVSAEAAAFTKAREIARRNAQRASQRQMNPREFAEASA